MIPNLRARLNKVADKPKQALAFSTCKVLESVMPLSAAAGLLDVTAEHVRWLGLDYPGWDVRRALFLDTETTGLRGAGTVAFLVGLGWIEGDSFIVRQYLMRDYPEEVDMLAQIAALLPQFDCYVSFNGKSFDIPLLRDRFIMARMRDMWRELPQLDLLHTARRTWKMRLGACNLGTLEANILDIHRVGDLPGAEVPERFFQFLKCGDMALLDDVLTHNEQDIRTLAILLAKLAGTYAQPEEQTSMLDVFSIGRALERCGEGERARRCFRVASVSELSEQARLNLAQSYKKERAYIESAETYSGMIARGEADMQVYTALAILQERYMGDCKSALETTEKALWRFSGGGFAPRVDQAGLQALERRRMRLRKRIAKQFGREDV